MHIAAHDFDIPLEITFPSAHHSPSTVNKKASEFVMGTVNESSAAQLASTISIQVLEATHQPAQ
jgi:hypothetical protein